MVKTPAIHSSSRLYKDPLRSLHDPLVKSLDPDSRRKCPRKSLLRKTAVVASRRSRIVGDFMLVSITTAQILAQRDDGGVLRAAVANEELPKLTIALPLSSNRVYSLAVLLEGAGHSFVGCLR